MEKEYNLINPAAIDERYFEAIALSKCDGCGLEDPNGNVLHRTYSALLLAVFARREGELEGAFWTLGGGNLPSDKFIAAHKRGYKDGYDLFLLRAEADKAANTIDWLKDVYQEGRKAKRKCATPLPLSVKSIQQNGYYTGMAVAASVILHRETTLFERAFGKPLVCGTAHPDVFEVTEPLGGEPLISIMDADTGTRIFDLSGKTPVDRERQSIQMHCFIGNQKRAFAEGREHLVSEAERYNRTDAIVHGYLVNEKAFAEHTLQNNYEATIRMDFLPGNKVKLNLDESLHIPPYIGVGQAIKYHGYSAKQAEAAKKEFLQNSILTKAQTQKRKKPEFDSLDELFHDVAQKEKCIDALKKVRVGKNKNRRTGIISSEGAWIEKNPNKSVLVAWIAVLRKESKIKTVDDLTLCRLLENHFPGLMLSADASNFRKCTDAATDYEADFLRLIK